MSYWRFAAMIATSTVVMFGLMYINTYAFEHVFFSETRTYMALLMGAAMAVIMLSFMLSMYSSKAINVAIYAGSVVVFGVTLWLIRSQETVDDTSYMAAMIPHHSIAIMTSERAQIEDPRVRKLADEIIAAQRKEIGEMRHLIADIEENGIATDPALGESEAPAEEGTVEEALSSAQLAGLDPVALIDIYGGDGAGHLGGDTHLFQRLDDAVVILGRAGDLVALIIGLDIVRPGLQCRLEH